MNPPRPQNARLTLAFALGCVFLPALGFGQPYSAGRYVIASGGLSADSRFSTFGAIGQPAVAPDLLGNGPYTEFSGYWNPVVILSVPSGGPVTTNTNVITNYDISIDISFPETNYLTTEPNIMVRGTVTGTVGAQSPFLSFVQVAVNSNVFGGADLDSTNYSPVAETTGGGDVWEEETVDWSTNLILVPGLNIITAQSISLQSSGPAYASFPVSRTIYYDAPQPSSRIKSPVTLLISPPGHGKISGAPNHARLEIDKVYTVNAAPVGNWVFTNWTIGTDTNSLSPLPNGATLSFVMSSNLVLQANFVTNPFTAVAGIYNGLFSPANGVAEQSSGFFTATINPSSRGVFSAKLQLDGGSYSFSGVFDLAGDGEQTVARSGKAPLAVKLHLNLAAADDQMTGYVINSTINGWSSALLADRAVFSTKSAPATHYAGCYTMILPESANSTNEPGGFGYATLTNNLAGQVTLAGQLGDGTAISQSVPVSKAGFIPLYVSLYSRGGSLQGWLALVNNPTNVPRQTILGAGLSWIKPSGKPGTLYAEGFTNTDMTILGSLYVPPQSGGNAFALANGTLTLSAGNSDTALTYSNLTIVGNALANQSAAGNPTNQLTGSINPKTGVLTIAFRRTDARVKTAAKGVILQDNSETNAAGWFLDGDQSGFFLLKQ